MARRASTIVDEAGLRLSYDKAAMLLGIKVTSLRVRLCNYRKLHPEHDTIELDELRRKSSAHNQLLDRTGKRVSYAKAADHLKIPVYKLYRLVGLLRVHSKAIREGSDIPIPFLEGYLSTRGEISPRLGI